MSQEDLIFNVERGRAYVTFNRPQAYNAMTFDMYEKLFELCEVINREEDIKVAIFAGAGGKAFVSGTDISQFGTFDEQAGLKYERRAERYISAVETIKKPTIAKISGYCVGGGASIALACDFRYATPDLRFGVPIAKTLGNCLSIRSLSRLVEAVGATWTKKLVMLARMVDGETAERIGLITECVAADELDSAVESAADRLISLAPLTLETTKDAVFRILESHRPSALLGADLVRRCYGSEDFHNAVQAFNDKTKPQWRGR